MYWLCANRIELRDYWSLLAESAVRTRGGKSTRGLSLLSQQEAVLPAAASKLVGHGRRGCFACACHGHSAKLVGSFEVHTHHGSLHVQKASTFWAY